VRLVELDYERTSKLTEGVLASGINFRGWAVTLTLALIALAFERNLWPISALSIVLILLLGIADAYYGWLYAEVLSHGLNAERLLHLYYAALSRGGDDPEAFDECEDALAAYKFGSFSEIKRFAVRDLSRFRPKLVFTISYATLLVVAVFATIAIAWINTRPESQLQCTEVAGMPGLYTCIDRQR
jgi:hypothetical protein